MQVKNSLLFRDVALTIEENVASESSLDLAPQIAVAAKAVRELHEPDSERDRDADSTYDDYVGDDYDDDYYG